LDPPKVTGLRQVPEISRKHPAESWMPLEKVDVPVVVWSWAISRPPEKVEVPIFVTVRFVIVVDPIRAFTAEANIDPPVRVRPFDEERPPVWKPPETVDEAEIPVRLR
jgi:hypothetical protein